MLKTSGGVARLSTVPDWVAQSSTLASPRDVLMSRNGELEGVWRRGDNPNGFGSALCLKSARAV